MSGSRLYVKWPPTMDDLAKVDEARRMRSVERRFLDSVNHQDIDRARRCFHF
jgi:hypothetical protein